MNLAYFKRFISLYELLLPKLIYSNGEMKAHFFLFLFKETLIMNTIEGSRSQELIVSLPGQSPNRVSVPQFHLFAIPTRILKRNCDIAVIEVYSQNI